MRAHGRTHPPPRPGMPAHTLSLRPPARAGADRQGEAEAPPVVHEVLRSPGTPLDEAARRPMESRFRHDFSRVRVHADARAAESARAVHAAAYTVGEYVVVGEGAFRPGEPAGAALLAHELAHARQAAGSAADSDIPLRIADPASPEERHAAAAARDPRAAAAGGVPTAASGTLFRQPLPQTQPPDASLTFPVDLPTGPPPGIGLRNPDRAERAMIEAADQRRKVVLDAAVPRLVTLAVSFRVNADPAFVNTAPLGRLNLFGEAQDPRTSRGQASIPHLGRALGSLTENRDTALPPSVVDEVGCAAKELARANDERDPRNPMVFCPAFFHARPECQAFVLMHELFHVIGIIGHGTGYASTVEWALGNPNALAAFAWRLASGAEPRCASFHSSVTPYAGPLPAHPRGPVA